MQPGKKIAVVGATGRVGRHVVDLLESAGHEVVGMSRSTGVDVVTGDGVMDALTGVSVIIDTASGPSPELQPAAEFFTTAAGNLHEAGHQAGVERIVVVSIIGCDRFTGGYNVAKRKHEEVALAGPIPVHILRAAQFHEFVEQLLQWGTRGGVGYVPRMRTQLVSARTVAGALVDLATAPESALTGSSDGQIPEIAGPRVESLVEMARLLAASRGTPRRVEEVIDPNDPDRDLFATDGLLPSPHAMLAGPTFEEWLDSGS